MTTRKLPPPTAPTRSQRIHNPALLDELNRTRAERDSSRSDLLALQEQLKAERAEAAAREEAQRVRHRVSVHCTSINLMARESQQVADQVMSKFQEFRPTPQAAYFDTHRAIVEAVADVDKNRINPYAGSAPPGAQQSSFAVDRQEVQRQRQLYTDKLRELGLQDPAHPSVPCGIG